MGIHGPHPPTLTAPHQTPHFWISQVPSSCSWGWTPPLGQDPLALHSPSPDIPQLQQFLATKISQDDDLTSCTHAGSPPFPSNNLDLQPVFFHHSPTTSHCPIYLASPPKQASPFPQPTSHLLSPEGPLPPIQLPLLYQLDFSSTLLLHEVSLDFFYWTSHHLHECWFTSEFLFPCFPQFGRLHGG